MPHIIVEHSENVTADMPALVNELHQTLAKEESVDIARIKSRAVPLKTYVVGDKGAEAQMIHITLKLMPRPADVAKRMALDLQNAARKKAGDQCTVTVEVAELHPDTYCA